MVKRKRNSLPQLPSETDLKQLIGNQTDVSLSFAKQILSLSASKDSNLVFSPPLIDVVLGLIAAGSNGPTQSQVLSLLNSKSTDDLNSLSSHLSLVFADGGPTGGPKLSFANGVWVDQSLSLKPSFKGVVDTVYKATLNHVDFQTKAVEVTNEVNQWAEKETNGLIKEVLPSGSVDDLTRLIYANALYFKGAWIEKFDASKTIYQDFHLLNGSSVRVPFMTSKNDQFVSEFDSFKVLRLPYKHGEDERRFSMYFFLPNAYDGLSALMEKVSSESGFLDGHLPCERVEVGRFRIPKFKFSFGFEASEVLKGLGLVLPFSPGEAGLTEMVESTTVGRDLYVSSIFHKAFIEVNEEGTKAAAASACVITWLCRTRKTDFVADHPFLFVIREDMTGVVLFIGQEILNSESTDDLNSLTSHLVSLVLADSGPAGGPTLLFANGVWVDQSLSLKPSFEKVVDTVYKATLNHVDFQTKAVEVTNEVNQWAEKETDGLIKEILPFGSINDLTRLIFANALYFKGAWIEKFDVSGNQIRRLPPPEWEFGEGKRRFSMYFFLPNAEDGLSALVEKVSSEFGFLDYHLPHERVEVEEFLIPKFKFSFGFEASKVLKGLGLVLPFSPGEGLIEMVDSTSVSRKLYISSFFHKACIEVNEEGTEAAAATSAGYLTFECDEGPKEIDFVADHPFLFVIREDMTGVALFIGRVLNPLVGGNAYIAGIAGGCGDEVRVIRYFFSCERCADLQPLKWSFRFPYWLLAMDSTLSLPMSFFHLSSGSKGPTQSQVLSLLNSKSTDDLNSLTSQLVSLVFADGRPTGPTLSFANGVWVDQSLSLKPSFEKVVDTVYKAALNHVDFQTKANEVTNEVNRWAKKETNGLIKEVLPSGSVNNLTRLIFANALYFKGAWTEKFKASKTKHQEFHLLNGSSVQVPFMTSKKDQFISEFNSFKVLRLPYNQGEDKRRFSMYLYLPNAKDGLSALMQKMSSKSGFLDRHLPCERVEVGEFLIPKFKFSFSFEASKVLKGIGLVLPFSPGEAGLTEMVESTTACRELYVSSIFHKAFIEVNEEGTKAAAASSGSLTFECYEEPEETDFVADHPFLFVIREDNTGAVLFIGQVLNPLVG
ncbi:hypothetical protein RHSIM_Rhsim07G0232500 [Rhododendron simsii]|uniref:Serpin domain-containing protein n=1 Tax=Rhododendron simsii TaxID=118357 RepID=A0A834GQ59_RHOSS|nr:hypothetical protein RHSIM_Rhsim07G0232500 [Rhododendron simsii]